MVHQVQSPQTDEILESQWKTNVPLLLSLMKASRPPRDVSTRAHVGNPERVHRRRKDGAIPSQASPYSALLPTSKGPK